MIIYYWICMCTNFLSIVIIFPQHFLTLNRVLNKYYNYATNLNFHCSCGNKGSSLRSCQRGTLGYARIKALHFACAGRDYFAALQRREPFALLLIRGSTLLHFCRATTCQSWIFCYVCAKKSASLCSCWETAFRCTSLFVRVKESTSPHPCQERILHFIPAKREHLACWCRDKRNSLCLC